MRKISKREFIRYGLIGLGGLFCRSNPVSGFQQLTSGGKAVRDSGLWKWSKEAYFYEKTPRGVLCQICPNECTLKLDELSDCRNRVNKDGKLYTIAYGNPCAVHVDPIEKKPLYHFLPTSRAFSIATAGCNLACMNCQNWTISQASPRETRNHDLMPPAVVDQCLSFNCKSIAYTYSEPITFYEYTVDTAKLAREKGIKNVIVSAGYINEEPLRHMCKYIDAANIDLKSFRDSIYLKLNAGKLEPVLNTLKILKEEKIWLEITNLVVPEWTDDFDMIRDMCKWLVDNDLGSCPLHFSRFQPMYKLTKLPATPLSTLERARDIALEEGVQFVYIGNVPGTGAESTYCPSCHKKLIDRRGFRILENNVTDGKCKFCGQIIPGVWS